MSDNNICRCGAYLPDVKDIETPYEFCSKRCKLEASIDEFHQLLNSMTLVPIIQKLQPICPFCDKFKDGCICLK